MTEAQRKRFWGFARPRSSVQKVREGLRGIRTYISKSARDLAHKLRREMKMPGLRGATPKK